MPQKPLRVSFCGIFTTNKLKWQPMNQSLYLFSLIISLPLMLFFGFHMLFGRTPEKKIYANYLLSRRLMGTALLILSANYFVHTFSTLRLRDVTATILMNLSTYFLCYWLFSSAMMTLLDNGYVTRRRFISHISMWLGFSALSSIVLFIPNSANFRSWCIAALAAWLVIYGMSLSVRLLRTYSCAIRMFENTHSDDIGSYIRWLSVFTYWAIGFGVSCGLLTFLPDEYVFLWILSSIPFYIYLYCSYQNYILFYEKVESAFRDDYDLQAIGAYDMNAPVNSEEGKDQPTYPQDIFKRIDEWIDSEGYRRSGITLNDLSAALGTNRTYLSQYIKSVYGMTFRDWISDLRIEYAKRLMLQQPQLRVVDISESSGFLSLSHFTHTFTAKEGCSPSKWRKKT